jgi:hypothetical protein
MKLTAKDNFYNTFRSFDVKDTHYLVGKECIHQVNLKTNKTGHLENLGIDHADASDGSEYYDEEEEDE